MSGLLGALLVAVGGGAGAATRFVVADTIRSRRPTGFPWGTWWVNELGSLLVGFVTGALLSAGRGADAEPWRLLLATGFCGGFTTFSTVTVESVTLARGGRTGAALANALGTLVVTVLAVAAGIAVASALV